MRLSWQVNFKQLASWNSSIIEIRHNKYNIVMRKLATTTWTIWATSTNAIDRANFSWFLRTISFLRYRTDACVYIHIVAYRQDPHNMLWWGDGSNKSRRSNHMYGQIDSFCSWPYPISAWSRLGRKSCLSYKVSRAFQDRFGSNFGSILGAETDQKSTKNRYKIYHRSRCGSDLVL